MREGVEEAEVVAEEMEEAGGETEEADSAAALQLTQVLSPFSVHSFSPVLFPRYRVAAAQTTVPILKSAAELRGWWGWGWGSGRGEEKGRRQKQGEGV